MMEQHIKTTYDDRSERAKRRFIRGVFKWIYWTSIIAAGVYVGTALST